MHHAADSQSLWDQGLAAAQQGLPPRPLTWPGGRVPSTSRAERFWLLIPVLGWIAFAVARRIRNKRMMNALDRQLLSRPFRPQVWGMDPRRRQLARLLCEVIAEELTWPAPYFVPADPLDVLFGRPCNGAEVVGLFDGIQERFHFDIRKADSVHTLGDLVDRCLAAADAKASPPSSPSP